MFTLTLHPTKMATILNSPMIVSRLQLFHWQIRSEALRSFPLVDIFHNIMFQHKNTQEIFLIVCLA